MSAVPAPTADAAAAQRDTLRALGVPRPGAALLWALVAAAVLGIAVGLGFAPAWTWWSLCAALALLALADLALLRRLPTPDAARRVSDALAIGIQTTVELTLDPGDARMRATVHDLHPGGWVADGLPRRVELKPGTLSTFEYRLRPGARGDFTFDGVQLLIDSPLRLWRQSRVSGAPRRVRVLPNFAPLTRLALAGAERASRLVGAHVTRRRGEGTDFRQMREYRVGDSMRQVDWKATARARKLISREYQDEKHQQVLLVVDTGRRMLARDVSPPPVGGATRQAATTHAGTTHAATNHFDHALDAALVVGYLALRQGDAVGLFASGGAQRWVPPQRGMAAIDTLLRAAYDLQPAPVATDYLAAAHALGQRQRRRSLLLWITNLRDEDTQDVLAAVRMLQKRHLVVIASLRERALDDALDTEVTELDQALRVGATARYLAERAAAHDLLRSHRVSVLDVTSDQLPAALVQEYLAIKRKGLL